MVFPRILHEKPYTYNDYGYTYTISGSNLFNTISVLAYNKETTVQHRGTSSERRFRAMKLKEHAPLLVGIIHALIALLELVRHW